MRDCLGRVLLIAIVPFLVVGCSQTSDDANVAGPTEDEQVARKTQEKLRSHTDVKKSGVGKSPGNQAPNRRPDGATVIRFVSKLSPKQKKQRAAMAKWDTAKYGDISKEWMRVRGAVSNPDPKSAEYKRAYELHTVYQIRLHRAFQRKFVVTGEVVDDAGKPVSDVTLRVTKSTSKIGGWGSQDENTRVKIGTKFKFVVDGGNTLHLSFWKKGYYPVMPSISDPDGDTHDGLVMINALKTDRFPRREVKKRLRIVLERQGKFTRLKRYRERIYFYPDLSAKVIDFDKPASDLSERSLHDLKNARDRKSWPRHCAVLLTETEGSGKHARISFTERPKSRFANGAKLVLSDPNGGLQLAKYELPRAQDLVDPNIKWKSWRIKQAPKTGYDLKELSLKGLKPAFDRPLCFYVKVDGKFGWGRIYEVRVAEGGTKIECHVEFRLQPDGSRNLEEEDRP